MAKMVSSSKTNLAYRNMCEAAKEFVYDGNYGKTDISYLWRFLGSVDAFNECFLDY